MNIVFACPRCQQPMYLSEDKPGATVRCAQCQLPLEVPLPKGQLIEVRPSAPGAVALAAPAPPPARSSPPSLSVSQPTPLPSRPVTPTNSTTGRLKADDLLKQASVHKEEGDLETAIRLLHEGYDEILGANALFSVEAFLRLPMYLQQAGKPREAWQEFNDLLFHGYTNQPRDVTLIAQDRTKIFDKMRLFLEAEGKSDEAAVFGVFSRVCKGISLHFEGRTKELRTWFNRSSCTEFVRTLKLYTGNLGKLQGIQHAIVGELDEYPSIDFDLLAQRIDVTLQT
jgi:hypothetical protein